jgi:hypothetical protein
MPNPWIAIAAVLTCIACYFGGMHIGAKTERADWQHEKLTMQEDQRIALLEEVNKRDRDRLFNETKARKATENHEKALAEVTEKYAADVADLKRRGGLRIPASICAARPAAAAGQAASAGRPDEGSAETVQLPERIEDGLFKLSKRADDLAEQLRALQGWIRANGFYGEPDDGLRRPE